MYLFTSKSVALSSLMGHLGDMGFRALVTAQRQEKPGFNSGK